MKKNADVVIIGGGIVGNSAAYYLAKRGIKNVIVLEESESIGHGGSSRNGGGVRQSGRDERELPYAIYSVEKFWPNLSEELGMDVEYFQSGNLRLGKTEAHMAKLQNLADGAQKLGLDVRMIDGKEVKELCPYLSDEIIGASWCPTDGHANPMLATLAYYKRAVELGVEFYTEAKVTAIKKFHGRARQIILEDGMIFEGENIILAAGYGSRQIARTVGIDIPMTKYFEEALVTEMQVPMFDMMLGTADADFYGHQCKHGSFVFGSESGLEEANDMKLYDLRTSSLTMSAGCRAIMGYIPFLKDARIVRSWGGWLDLSIDGVPVISYIDEVPGLILACAFTGHGFGTAPAVGYMLAQMVEGERTAVDITALRYDRFKSLR
ncbi:MAG: FAD-binding oxidoreductase [Clostridium sp.]|jgi:sarcosine oxidase subunit beta|uniref:NAD(P)/FAD-dependent oxidoreductase n=1 Tax=Clostridium sp. TaxID=1506 RepID=UPI0025BFBDF2|nr:FAD-binding oxidoreductase [Clostridium sp.]MCH3963340.1 FAD-binding oxidoreductase [Clostridium sp.]MCI1716792.1 FAD-binding oxidoreductase [Clostridium sp.]MCI1801024.1 FAD-binding oxidoreductase [Clostridium sp.]MCI1814978.1 FAD-binding oxidoreductase [Clostridium sp.]MCI1871879.1 FAD-binding oxidoreductase [Clostridium sp.]